MTTRTCLRCDWQGTTDEKRCPNCSEPLYELGKPPSEGTGGAVRGHPEERSREAASTASVAPSASPSRPPSLPPRAPSEPSATRSRPLVALVLTVIVLAVAVGSWLNAHTELPATAARQQIRPTGLTGTLIYAVPDGADRSRLWRWDLSTGGVVRGPRVPRAIELVDARGADPGWVGVTSELPDGRLQASVLRFLGPDDRATPILEGDSVSWGPEGATVIAGRRGPLRPGCRRSVSIVWAKLVLRSANESTPIRRSAATCSRSGRTAPARCSRWIAMGTSPSTSPGERPGRSIASSRATPWSRSRRYPTSSWFRKSRSPARSRSPSGPTRNMPISRVRPCTSSGRAGRGPCRTASRMSHSRSRGCWHGTQAPPWPSSWGARHSARGSTSLTPDLGTASMLPGTSDRSRGSRTEHSRSTTPCSWRRRAACSPPPAADLFRLQPPADAPAPEGPIVWIR